MREFRKMAQLVKQFQHKCKVWSSDPRTQVETQKWGSPPVIQLLGGRD